jgi:exonuclease III
LQSLRAAIDSIGEAQWTNNYVTLLAESKPDVACLQELKAPQEKFPEAAICEAGPRASLESFLRAHNLSVATRA